MTTTTTDAGAAVKELLPRRPIEDITDVLEFLGEIQRALAMKDGVRYFNGLYLDVTSEVARLLRGTQAEDPAFLERLDVIFANFYFRAVADAASEPAVISPAWRPLFRARHDMRVAPAQFALSGVNAHINYDLSVTVVETCRLLGVAPQDDSPQHRDFERINGLIATVQERTQRDLLTGLLGKADRALGRVDDVVAGWSIERARDAAWTNAKLLWQVRDEPALATSFMGSLAQSVGLIGRKLLLPSSFGVQRRMHRLGDLVPFLRRLF